MQKPRRFVCGAFLFGHLTILVPRNPMAVIPAKAEALYNSEAGQSIFASASQQNGFPLSRE
jgi:hypothetical protein